MDIAQKIIILICTLLVLVMAAVFRFLGYNDISVFINSLLLAGTGYLLFFANTPLRANRYRVLQTPWTQAAKHKEYPRPQLQRQHWINLNGSWDYAIRPRKEDTPSQFDGKIQVPFPLESDLSGADDILKPSQRLWYRRQIEINDLSSDILRLHFGAVDYECDVWLNGKHLAKHLGGHDAFYVDIEQALLPGKPQELIVAVWDPTDKGIQGRGKQSLRPSNIYYKAVSGIWQTVWLEPLAASHILDFHYHSDIDSKTLSVNLGIHAMQNGDRISLQVFDKQEELEKDADERATLAEYQGSDTQFTLTLPEYCELWSPDNPRLYPVEISLSRTQAGKTDTLDTVSSYIALRKIEIKKDNKGINRAFLNNQPVFHLGLLDQGWWPDGLYTAPSDAALQYDIKISKAMGFNMIRKHVKVEPARWYYHCDRLGMMVWQDMPTSDRNILPRQKDLKRSEASALLFHQELEAMLSQLRFFQCIVCWVPFNEGWGQFDTNTVLEKVKSLDPHRLVDGPSGWNDRGVGDFRDYHIYMRTLYVGSQKAGRAEAIGEFGGIGYKLPQHMAVINSWSYNNVKTADALAFRYRKLFEQELMPLVEKGLSAAVYTQTTDVESEINGLLTYDRKVEKIPVGTLASLHTKIFIRFQELTAGGQ